MPKKKTDYSDFSYLGKPASYFLEKMKKGMRISPGFKRVWSDYMQSKKAKKTADEIMVDNFVQIDALEKKVRKGVSPSVPYSPSYSISPSISNTPSISDSYSLSREADDDFDGVSVSPSESEIWLNAVREKGTNQYVRPPVARTPTKKKKREPLPSLENPRRKFRFEEEDE